MSNAKTESNLPRHCTFDENDWALLSTYWFPVALESKLSEGPFGTMLLDQPLVIYQAGNEIVVAADICPHRGVPLSMGTQDGETIRCAYHGLRFGAGGKCNEIPASPGIRIADRLHLKTYPAMLKYGLVWTRLTNPGETADPGKDIPAMPSWDDPDYQQIICPTIDIAGFAGRQMEGFLDVAHFGWVHTETFGDPANTIVPPYMPILNDIGFEVEYRSFVGNYPIGADTKGAPGFEWLRHFRVHLPFTATLTVHFPDAGRLVIMNAASPISARKTRLFAPIARNFDKHIPIEAVHEFNRRVFEEDRRIVEAQMPEYLPLDPSLEAHIPADRSSIAYRKGLRSLGFSPLFAA